MTRPANIAGYREAARRKLPRLLFDYIDGGSYSEQTLRRNVGDLERVLLRQRVLEDISSVDTRVKLVGQDMAMPVVLSPVGLAGMYARRGEVQAARAAKEKGVPFCLSSVSICGLEEVASGAGCASWFQMYMIKDRGYMQTLLERAVSLRCPALVFTVDLPVPASRYRDSATGFVAQPSLQQSAKRAIDAACHPAWVWDVWMRGRPHSFGNFATGIPEARRVANFWSWIAKNYEPRITWRDVDWVRDHWDGPIVIKGIMDVEDARHAVDIGVDAIAVSNHGGRQLDGAASTISMLPAIADEVAQRIPVFMDGGIRSGVDVLKALASGASACLLGRAWAYALAADGERGVAHMLDIVQAELRTAMALSGCTKLVNARDALATTERFKAEITRMAGGRQTPVISVKEVLDQTKDSLAQ
jgi:L-lactate dehydrogenase (cytochrome)